MAPSGWLLSFRVNGVPVEQGSKIPGINRRTGKAFVREQAGKRLKDWRADVTAAAEAAMQQAQLLTVLTPLWLDVVFWVPRPRTVSVAKRKFPCVKPDLDKYIRAVGDALGDANVYASDSQIVKIQAFKLYADEYPPGVDISVGLVL